ncbi:MAG: hypothetical protein KJ964_02410 [Verrucomicrobia bacterium]|nr:hypothetical protein [Verrucomicrobiota bacterium]MBU1735898.1 hypothetical protein [Verrucomicrobiota bacterium]MBU1857133.1 hypothetical protein [Verrucomicrobiota bacterium]
MQTLITFCIVVMLPAYSAVAGGDKQFLQKFLTERYIPTVRSALLPRALAGSEKSFTMEDAQCQYIDCFFRGYLHGLESTPGTVTVGAAGGPQQTGFDDGLQHYHALQSTTNQPFSLHDFGYTPVTTSGTYKWAFEDSGFKPDSTNENWWVDFQVGVVEHCTKKKSFKQQDLFSVRRRCRFKGFLSPDGVGFTGHMGQYYRKFIVTEIQDIGPSPPRQNDHEMKNKIEDGQTKPRTVP